MKGKINKVKRRILKKIKDDNWIFKDELSLIKEENNGQISIGSEHTMMLGGYFLTGWGLSLKFDIIELFILKHKDLFNSHQMDRSEVATINLSQLHFLNKLKPEYIQKNWFKFFPDEPGLKLFEEYSWIFLNEFLFPLSMQMEDVSFIDKYYNSVRKPESPYKKPVGMQLSAYQFKRIIVSKLAGSDNWKWLLEDLEADVSYYRSLLGTEEGGGLENYDKLPPIIEEFKEYIQGLQPLKNPNLFSEENTIS